MNKYSSMTVLQWRKQQVLIKLNENKKIISQHLIKPKLGILGAFHGTNVGDNTLGLSVANICKFQNLRYGLQNIYNLGVYPKSELTICAGGATGVNSNITLLAQSHPDSAAQTALIGMDFAADIGDFSDHALEFLSNVKYISCRSKNQAQKVALALNRDDIHYQLDNAFAYDFNSHNQEFIEKNNKIFGFNALPFFMQWVRKKGFSTGTSLESWYRKNNNNFAKYIQKLGPQYIEYIQKVLSIYISRGWQVHHIPFTPEDDVFAKTFFKMDGVNFIGFNPSPQKTFLHISNCDIFLSTRYHSLVFSLIARVPCIPFMYAGKCNDLISDIGFDSNLNHAIDRLEIIHSFDQALEKTVNPNPYLLDKSYLENIYASVANNIYQASQIIQS